MNFVILIELMSMLMVASAGDYNYAEVLEKSLLFYEAQRTGYLPADNRIPWRGNSFVTDRGDDGEDLSGGYFDGNLYRTYMFVIAFNCFNKLTAGDHVKFQFPAAGAMTYLAWGMYDSKDGYRKAGQWEQALSCLKWGMDYFIKV